MGPDPGRLGKVTPDASQIDVLQPQTPRLALGTPILITGARAPVALHLTRLLAVAGHPVTLVDHLRHPLAAASQYARAYHQIPPFQTEPEAARAALAKIIADAKIRLVIPTCEEVLHLGALWARHEMGAPLFAPGFDRLSQVHNKYRFIELCREIGLATPQTTLLTSEGDRNAQAPNAAMRVFKPVWSRFGADVLIRPAPRKLSRITPTPEAPWVAQEYLMGDEVCTYAIADQGQLKALAAYRGLVKAGPGAAVCFAPVDPEMVRPFVDKFVRATAWTGQISFDLMHTASGAVLPLECNPRPTSGLHFFADAGAFADALCRPNKDVRPDITHPLSVRLALWLYGLPKLANPETRSVVLDALRQSKDVLSWPGDHLGLPPQLKSVAEFAAIALHRRMSLERASTWGIEWNGPDQSSIS